MHSNFSPLCTFMCDFRHDGFANDFWGHFGQRKGLNLECVLKRFCKSRARPELLL
jgi:hypothetical protein